MVPSLIVESVKSFIQSGELDITPEMYDSRFNDLVMYVSDDFAFLKRFDGFLIVMLYKSEIPLDIYVLPKDESKILSFYLRSRDFTFCYIHNSFRHIKLDFNKLWLNPKKSYIKAPSKVRRKLRKEAVAMYGVTSSRLLYKIMKCFNIRKHKLYMLSFHDRYQYLSQVDSEFVYMSSRYPYESVSFPYDGPFLWLYKFKNKLSEGFSDILSSVQTLGLAHFVSHIDGSSTSLDHFIIDGCHCAEIGNFHVYTAPTPFDSLMNYLMAGKYYEILHE